MESEQPFFVTAEELRFLSRFNSLLPVENEKYFDDKKKYDFEDEIIILALQQWVAKFLVKNDELNSLLRILNKIDPKIPKDSKSLMDIYIVTKIEEENENFVDEIPLDDESNEEDEPVEKTDDPVYNFDVDEIVDPNYVPMDPLSDKQENTREKPPIKEPEKLPITMDVDDNSNSSEKFFNNVKCPECSKEYKTFEGLRFHKMRAHKISEKIMKSKRSKQCPICGVFRASLINHMRVHTGEKPYKCKFCEQGFKDAGTCNRHERTHTGIKPFKCNFCDKSFNQSTFRNEHMRIHTGVKPHECVMCPKAFRTGHLLKLHNVKTHGVALGIDNLNKTPFEKFDCNLCSKNFASSYGLKIHQQVVHKGEPLFKCTICENKTFATNSVLKVHMMAHKGERPYNCIECNKAFSQMEGLRLHNKRHHNIGTDEKFVCKHCDREFMLSSYMKRHIRKMHPEKIVEEKNEIKND